MPSTADSNSSSSTQDQEVLVAVHAEKLEELMTELRQRRSARLWNSSTVILYSLGGMFLGFSLERHFSGQKAELASTHDSNTTGTSLWLFKKGTALPDGIVCEDTATGSVYHVDEEKLREAGYSLVQVSHSPTNTSTEVPDAQTAELSFKAGETVFRVALDELNNQAQ